MGIKIDRKLAAYSAAVAAVATGLSSTDAHGAVIVGSNTPLTLPVNGGVNVDFNGDATNDISITDQTAAKNGNNRYYVNGGTYATTPYVDAVPGTPQVRPEAFTAGQIIDGTSTFGTDPGDLGNTLAGNNLVSTDANAPGTVSGNFAEDGTTINYLGVQFVVGGQTDYGYVGLVLNPAPVANDYGTGTVTGQIVSYAYDDSGAGIAAGATSSPAPEPAGLSTLALGAAALMRRKRPS